MDIFIIGFAGLIAGFVIGALVYRKNEAKIVSTVEAVSKAADDIKQA
jgi:hypothetical protein